MSEILATASALDVMINTAMNTSTIDFKGVERSSHAFVISVDAAGVLHKLVLSVSGSDNGSGWSLLETRTLDASELDAKAASISIEGQAAKHIRVTVLDLSGPGPVEVEYS